jgi:hypothetical protein
MTTPSTFGATSNVVLDEYTNIGIIVFDENGKQFYSRIDITRAQKRGDLPADCEFTERLKDYPKRFPTTEQVMQALKSTPHAMSCVQITEPLGTVLRESHDDLFERLVLGVTDVRRKSPYRDEVVQNESNKVG